MAQGFREFRRSAAPMIALIAAITFFARFIKRPKRPDPDPLEGARFEENGAVKKEK